MIEKNSTQNSTDFTCNGVMKHKHEVYYIQVPVRPFQS